MPPTPPPPVPTVTSSGPIGFSCGQGLAYLLMRVMLGFLLIMAGADKFKSPAMPYDFKFSYWHDKTNEAGEVVEYGKWRNVAKPVFEFGGFNNTEVYGVRGVNFLTHVFKLYALALPYLMLGVGFFILIGFLNRLSLFLGGGIWLSLAVGQMTLPDNPTVWMLTTYTLFYVVALALAKYNRFAVTRY